jgi:SAM-dependent methyltransferase
MDLSERRHDQAERHPWEQSRALAVERIVRRGGTAVQSILDYGCGDAYTGRVLLERLRAESLVGVDVYLTPEDCARYSAGDRRVELHRNDEALEGRFFDLALLCDVIEHVDDDVSLLRLVKARLRAQGRILVTVPAFQMLFTAQDRALKHLRRYTLFGLEKSLRAADLTVISSGYLFGSLLVVRAAEKLLELAGRTPADVQGIGKWNGGRLSTRMVAGALGADNALLLALARRRVKLPGLSAWALCAAA